MNVEVENSISQLLERVVKRGKTATLEEVNSFNADCEGIIPNWYTELLLKHPICGLQLRWQFDEPTDDDDGVWWLEWSDVEAMRNLMLEAYPGVAIYRHGYLNIAFCMTGSGDDYFINVNEGDNPRVLQIWHDVSDKPEIIISEGISVIAESLSAFFNSLKVED